MGNLSAEQVRFHELEFTSLKGEVSYVLTTLFESLKYSAAGSALIFSWLMVNRKYYYSIEHPGYTLALFAPLALSACLSLYSLACGARLREIGEYLKKLEYRLGDPDLGWEKFLEQKKKSLTNVGIVGWVFLLTCDAITPLILS